MWQKFFVPKQSRFTLPTTLRTNQKATQMRDVQWSVRQTRATIETLSQSSWSRDTTDFGAQIHQSHPIKLAKIPASNKNGITTDPEILVADSSRLDCGLSRNSNKYTCVKSFEGVFVANSYERTPHAIEPGTYTQLSVRQNKMGF